MLVLEPQHLPDLPVRQRRLILAHLPRHRRTRRELLQHLGRWFPRRDGIVGRVEHLEAQPILLHAPIADLAQVPRVNVAPRVPLARLGFAHEVREEGLVLVGLDDVADPQGVDVDAGEAARESPRAPLPAQLAGRVRVLRVVVVVLLEREDVVVDVALGEADAVGRFRAGDDDLWDAELTGGFDDVVRAQHVAAEAFAVRDEQVSGVGGEVDDGVGFLDTDAPGAAGVLVVGEVEVG